MGRYKANSAHVFRATKSSWSTDDSRFGKKLIEKMGWQEGKGLGRHENGTVDPIQASYKYDQKGLGFAEDPADKFKAVDDYSSILANINQIFAQPAVEPQENSSKLSLKGKDVSEKDYQCIFGKVKPITEVKRPTAPKKPSSLESGFVAIKSELNSNAYFAKKFAEKMEKLKGQKVKLQPQIKQEADSDDERPMFQIKEEPEETFPLSFESPSASASIEESYLSTKSILSRIPKNFVYGKAQVHSGRKIRFSKQVNLLHVDLTNNFMQELVYPHQKNTSVMSRFREFNKENSEPPSPNLHDLSTEEDSFMLEDQDLLELEPDIIQNGKAKKKMKKKNKCMTTEALECLDDTVLIDLTKLPITSRKNKKSVSPADEGEENAFKKDNLNQLDIEHPFVSKRKGQKRKHSEVDGLPEKANTNSECDTPRPKKKKKNFFQT